MRPVRVLFVLGVAALLAASPAFAHKSSGKDGGKGKKDEGGDGFEAKVKDLEKIEGLFNFYFNEEENTYLMEIGADQLDKIYLCSTAREAGDGMYYDSGSMGGEFPFRFEKVGKTINLVHDNVYYRADESLPIAGAIERGLTNSIVGSATLETDPHPDSGSFLIDPAGFFVQDYYGVASALGERAKLDYSMDDKGSHFARIRSFPHNSEIETVLHFKSRKSRATNMRIPDSRSMQHRYRFSLVEIPESDYVPRYADDRVGHFTTMFQDYSDLERDTPYKWYVNRWHLEKADPTLAVSPVKEPIVYWIENSTPHEYRDAIRRGAELWNTAFEKAGFKNAVVVKQMPDDAEWDPADVRYNVIRWIVQPGGGYAVGPSHANPFTGELYAADIRISSDFVRYYFNSYEQYIDPLAAFSDIVDGLDARPEPHACRYSHGKSMEAGLGADWLMLQGFVDPDSPELRQFINDGIVDLVAHEVGHTLGFRHNFRASNIHDLDQVHDMALTAQEGISGSVMDYNPVNIAPKGKAQGRYWCTNLGVYDFLAVEYAYTPFGATSPDQELAELDKIASRSGSDSRLLYATDEDAFGFGAQSIDPNVNMWDLGPDTIAFYRERLGLAADLLGGIEETFGKDGAQYSKMRSVFGRAMRQYFQAANTVSKYVGGVNHYRDHAGSASGRTPFVPVPAAKQREALAFLSSEIFDADLPIHASLVRKLTADRRNDFNWSAYFQPRVDYPVHAAILSAQNVALNRLYHPITLNRLVDIPLLYEDGEDVLTMGEMFKNVRGSIWSEVSRGRNVSSDRRNLQRAHLDKLIQLVVAPRGAPIFTPSSGSEPAGRLAVPEDARSFARADLTTISANLRNALNSGSLDGATRAHLSECRARVDAALAAGLERKM